MKNKGSSKGIGWLQSTQTPKKSRQLHFRGALYSNDSWSLGPLESKEGEWEDKVEMSIPPCQTSRIAKGENLHKNQLPVLFSTLIFSFPLFVWMGNRYVKKRKWAFLKFVPGFRHWDFMNKKTETQGSQMRNKDKGKQEEGAVLSRSKDREDRWKSQRVSTGSGKQPSVLRLPISYPWLKWGWHSEDYFYIWTRCKACICILISIQVFWRVLTTMAHCSFYQNKRDSEEFIL